MQNLYFDDDLYKDKYRASTARLQGWDYGSNGLYYLTICTEHRLHYFGEIVSDQNSETQNVALLQPTIIGEVAHHNWLDIPSHFSFVELDEFVIMPNHVHGILFINKPDKTDWKLNTFGAQSQNLGSVMRGYKASVKTFATTNNIEFGWQPRYYDHVIRNEKEYLNISGYIADNAQQWLLNGDKVDNIFKP